MVLQLLFGFLYCEVFLLSSTALIGRMFSVHVGQNQLIYMLLYVINIRIFKISTFVMNKMMTVMAEYTFYPLGPVLYIKHYALFPS